MPARISGSAAETLRDGRLLILTIAVLTIIGLASTGSTLAQPGGDGYVKKFQVKAFRYGYDPATLVVEQGDIVVVTVESVDVAHGFYVEGYDVREDYIVPGEPRVVAFTADKPGKFPIHCSVICGPLRPFQRGQLVVQPNIRFAVGVVGTITVAGLFIAYHWIGKREARFGA